MDCLVLVRDQAARSKSRRRRIAAGGSVLSARKRRKKWERLWRASRARVLVVLGPSRSSVTTFVSLSFAMIAHGEFSNLLAGGLDRASRISYVAIHCFTAVRMTRRIS